MSTTFHVDALGYWIEKDPQAVLDYAMDWADWLDTDTITGKEYMIDGGNDYVRSSANGDEIYITITDDVPFEVARQFFSWGTRGKDGRQPIQYKPLMSLDTDHIEAILETQDHISTETRSALKRELEFRG
jgi:hypothetical protein